METFIKKVLDGKKIQLLIDTKIFSKDIVLKTAFSFLDRGYFFFKLDENKNIIVQISLKDKSSVENLIGEFSSCLLEVYLRDKLEKDNKNIRETIVKKAINGPFDTENFVSLDTDNKEKNQIDFDKDIDEILKEIENDPDLKIDEEEIEKILQEIEEETNQKPNISVNTEAIKDVKKQFKKNK